MSNAGKEIYQVASTGKIQMWKAEILNERTDKGYVQILATYGYTDGKKQTKVTEVKSGKNTGKKNETSIEEQAVIKLEQMYADKIKKKAMVYDVKDWVKPERPMLAQPYQKRKKAVAHVKKWLIGPKLDGNRSYHKEPFSVMSKSGNVTTPVSYISRELNTLIEPFQYEIHIDGEFYKHGVDLTVISGIVNTEDESKRRTDVTIEYHIYDCFIPSKPDMRAEDRRNLLEELFANAESEFLVLNPSEEVANDEDLIREIVRRHELAGYEGSILRDPDGTYQHSKNSADRNDVMLKYKNMKEDDFPIIDITENEDQPGTPKFHVQLPTGEVNAAVLKGDKDEARKFLENREHYIQGNHWLQTQFQNYTVYGKLEFAVGLQVREGKIVDSIVEFKH